MAHFAAAAVARTKDDQIEIKYVSAAAAARSSKATLSSYCRKDGSVSAFDKNLGVDLTPPSVKMAWPNAGDQVSGRAPMELIFLVNDDGSGINYDSLEFGINGQDYIPTIDKEGRVPDPVHHSRCEQTVEGTVGLS